MNFKNKKKKNNTSIPKVSKINLNMIKQKAVIDESENTTVKLKETPVKKVEPVSEPVKKVEPVSEPVKKDELSDLASLVNKNINIIKKVEENEKKQQKQRTANKSMFSKPLKSRGCGCGKRRAKK